MRCASSRIKTSSPLRSAVINWLKYLNIFCTRGARAPATLRSVWVNEREPVACSTERPCRASSPNSDSATTDLPLPGPPLTTITRLLSAPRACSTAWCTRSTASC